MPRTTSQWRKVSHPSVSSKNSLDIEGRHQQQIVPSDAIIRVTFMPDERLE
jgi:hypothetical protein